MHQFHTFVDYVLITKRWEYGIAFVFMGLFILFYKFLRTPSVKTAAMEEAANIMDMIEGFIVPRNFLFHQGHTWVKREPNDTVVVGMDDFAQKLVGNIRGIRFPVVGAEVSQGEKAWTMDFDSKSVDMLSPVDGKILAVNNSLRNSPEQINSDPYGKGWFLKIKPTKISKNLKNLLSGDLAARWTEKALEDITASLSPNLGLVRGDGGIPVSGMARNIDQENWDKIAKKFFLTEE